MFSSCETIVISAAGLGFARLLGMVVEAENLGMFSRSKCKTILATSAGCFIALSIGLGIQSDQLIQELMVKMHSKRFHQGSFFTSLVKGITDGYMLDTQLREELIDELLLLAKKEKNLSFEEIYLVSGIQLSFNAVDIDSGRMHHLGYFTTPEMSVKDAILASTSIPTLFPPQEINIQGKMYRFIDGGLHSYLDLDALDPGSFAPIQYDPFYFGRKVPEDYDIGFLTYSSLGDHKIRNDMFTIMHRMLHIMQLGVVEKLTRAPKVIASKNSSSLSYFSELSREQIESEIEAGKEYIRHLLSDKRANLPVSLKCLSI